MFVMSVTVDNYFILQFYRGRGRGGERQREKEIILIPPFTCLTVFEGMNVN